MRKSDIRKEMKRSGVAMKREKKDSVIAEDADVEPSFDAGIVALGKRYVAEYGKDVLVVLCRTNSL